MNDSLYLGAYGPNNQRWSAGVRLGQLAYTPIELEMDPTLPALGQDPNNDYRNRDYVVIPRGRIVAVKSQDLTDQARKTVITMANGVDPLNKPSFADYASSAFGYAPFNLYRNLQGLPAETPLGVRHETIAMPYTSANEAYNDTSNGGSRLKVGEYVMPYYGSNSKQKQNYTHTGKMVRYVGRHVISTTVASASAIVLLDAKYPAFQPVILFAHKADASLVTSGATLTYDETAAKWKATFLDQVKTVVFEYGAANNQRIGQIMGIEPVKDAGGINSGANHEMTGWFKWVQTNYGPWEYPLVLNRLKGTAVVDESVSVSNNQGTLAGAPVQPFKTVTVKVTGTRYNSDGTTTALSDTTLDPLDDQIFGDKIHGNEYDLDILSGVITFTGNLAVTGAKVSYTYETDFKTGIDWDGQGILGLTDGSGPAGIVGLPPHLDVLGVYGELRVAIL